MRKKTQYIVVNEIYKTIYCGYPQKRAWKIITGSSGGMFLTDSKEDANKARKWSTQSREDAPWYQHEELGYNYRMSNVIAGVVRGQFPYLEEHIQQKKEIYERYKDGLKDLPVNMNPIPEECEPNYWLSCLIIDKDAICRSSTTPARLRLISALHSSLKTVYPMRESIWYFLFRSAMPGISS